MEYFFSISNFFFSIFQMNISNRPIFNYVDFFNSESRRVLIIFLKYVYLIKRVVTMFHIINVFNLNE